MSSQVKERELRADPETLERLRRGLCQQAAGLKEQLSGVQQQIRALDSLKKQTGQQPES